MAMKDPVITFKTPNALEFLRKCYMGTEDGPAPVRVIRVIMSCLALGETTIRALVRCKDGITREATASITIVGGDSEWDPGDTKFTYQYAPGA